MIKLESFNQWTGAGPIRSRVEHRVDDQGTKRCSFSIRTEPYGKTDYQRIRARGEWATACEGLKMGDWIGVIGPILTERSGGKTERVCVMEHLEILSRRDGAGSAA